MRNYRNIDKYLDELQRDIYEQPEDPGHTTWAVDVIEKHLPQDVVSVLDVGCGQGFCSPLFGQKGIAWTGVTLGTDYEKATEKGRNVHRQGISFLQFADASFDLVFARHVLEHSPMPLLTLMEWYRVSAKYLLLVMPDPEYWGIGGINHYYVLDKNRLWYLLDRAGWEILNESTLTTSDDLFMATFLPEQSPEERVWSGHPKVVEYRMLLEKK